MDEKDTSVINPESQSTTESSIDWNQTWGQYQKLPLRYKDKDGNTKFNMKRTDDDQTWSTVQTITVLEMGARGEKQNAEKVARCFEAYQQAMSENPNGPQFSLEITLRPSSDEVTDPKAKEWLASRGMPSIKLIPLQENTTLGQVGERVELIRKHNIKRD